MKTKDKPTEIELPQLACLQCGHTWAPRRNTPPEICPRCKSRRWNTPDPDDPADPDQQSASEKRAVTALVEIMRHGHQARTRAILKLLDTEHELLNL